MTSSNPTLFNFELTPLEQVQPWGERARTTRERLSSESIAVGTVMLALNSILVGKPLLGLTGSYIGSLAAEGPFCAREDAAERARQ